MAFITEQQVIPVTIDVGEDADLTPAVDLGGYALTAIGIPASMDSTSLTFEACDTIDGTYTPINAQSGVAAITVAINSSAGVFSLNTDDFVGIRFLKVKAGTNEGANRELKLYLVRAGVK